jgi:hypothetical protein
MQDSLKRLSMSLTPNGIEFAPFCGSTYNGRIGWWVGGGGRGAVAVQPSDAQVTTQPSVVMLVTPTSRLCVGGVVGCVSKQEQKHPFIFC